MAPRPIEEAQVDVWYARPAAASADDLARCLALLSPEERVRIQAFHFERHAREASISRALVRRMLATYVDRAAETFCYRLGPFGRPHVEPPCGVAFSAANHPDLVACAIAGTEEIGIDVEPVSRGDEILEVAALVFAAPEIAALAALSLDARRDRAVSLWTCKEAYIKARGLGMSAPLREIVVDFPAGARPTIRFLSAVDAPDGWWLDTRDVHGVRLAIAVRSRGTDVRLVVEEVAPGPSATSPRCPA